MMCIFIVIILLGFPIAFTLIAMGVFFGYYAMGVTTSSSCWSSSTFGVMSNDVLIAVPLFLFMGYMVERSNILDRLFYSLQVSASACAGVARGRDADHLRVVRDRNRHRRRGGHADGPARVSGDAQAPATTPSCPPASSAPAAVSASSSRRASC